MPAGLGALAGCPGTVPLWEVVEKIGRGRGFEPPTPGPEQKNPETPNASFGVA
jgi:hypothetical protein